MITFCLIWTCVFIKEEANREEIDLHSAKNIRPGAQLHMMKDAVCSPRGCALHLFYYALKIQILGSIFLSHSAVTTKSSQRWSKGWGRAHTGRLNSLCVEEIGNISPLHVEGLVRYGPRAKININKKNQNQCISRLGVSGFPSFQTLLLQKCFTWHSTSPFTRRISFQNFSISSACRVFPYPLCSSPVAL